MTQNIKVIALVGQAVFAWFYSFETNYCTKKSCSSNSYVSFILILAALALFDWYFLRFYPRFKKIPIKIFTIIILVFPLLLYLGGVILNDLTKRPLSVLIIGILIAVAYRALWIYLARGKLSLQQTEYLALTSLFLLIFSSVFLIANLNLAVSSYLTYHNPNNDIYIVGNGGKKSTFLNYKFR